MVNVQNMNIKYRLFLIDIMRVVCVLLIYMRHSITMYGCTYGSAIDYYISLSTSPVMTCFFIISGFSIHYQYRTEEITSEWTRKFLKKRLISIMPSYLLIVLIWPLFHPDQLKVWVELLPVELLGVQTSYNTLFGTLHNGGTWFVSCILFAYVLYPVVKSVLKSTKSYVSIMVLIIGNFMLVYSIFIVNEFSLDGLYSNPIARSVEFIIGVAFADLVFGLKTKAPSEETRGKKDPPILKWEGWKVVCIIALISIISIILAKSNNVNGRMSILLHYLVIPTVLVALLISSYIRCRYFEKSKLLAIFSGMSYQFFLMQLFLWDITSYVIRLLNLQGNNIEKISVSFIVCTVCAFVVWRFYDKPIERLVKKKFQIK